MLKRLSIYVVFAWGFVLFVDAGPGKAQVGNSGSIEGVVRDPSGGVVAGATVEVSYPVRPASCDWTFLREQRGDAFLAFDAGK